MGITPDRANSIKNKIDFFSLYEFLIFFLKEKYEAIKQKIVQEEVQGKFF